jgi:hypothetical protein
MGWNFEDVGGFPDQKSADDWAKANKIDPRDVDIRSDGGRRVSVSVRRSALTDDANNDRNNGRSDGFF